MVAADWPELSATGLGGVGRTSRWTLDPFSQLLSFPSRRGQTTFLLGAQTNNHNHIELTAAGPG